MDSQSSLNIAFIEHEAYSSFCGDFENADVSGIGQFGGYELRCSTPLPQNMNQKMEFSYEFNSTFVIEASDPKIDEVSDALANIGIQGGNSEEKTP